jgi:hypothetical protein
MSAKRETYDRDFRQATGICEVIKHNWSKIETHRQVLPPSAVVQGAAKPIISHKKAPVEYETLLKGTGL